MLYFTEKGKGNTIVFLHGFLENHKIWEYYKNELSDNYHVVCIDLPGHGNSANLTNEVNRMEDISDRVNEVLDFLNVKHAIIIGHSMGGYVSLAFADKYKTKVNGLGLFYSTPLADDEVKKEQRLKAAEVATKNPKEFFRLSIPNLFAQKNLPRLKSEIEEAISWATQTSLVGISASLKGMRLRLDRTEVIKNLGKPVFVIAGEYDNAVKTEELKKAIKDFPNVSYYTLPTGHMGMLEAPEESLQVIKAWLKENNL